MASTLSLAERQELVARIVAVMAKVYAFIFEELIWDSVAIKMLLEQQAQMHETCLGLLPETLQQMVDLVPMLEEDAEEDRLVEENAEAESEEEELVERSYDDIMDRYDTDSLFRSAFGLSRMEFKSLYPHLRLGDERGGLRTTQEYIDDYRVALLVTLNFFKVGSLRGAEQIFGRRRACAARLKAAMVRHINEKWSHLLDIRYSHLYGLTPGEMRRLSIGGDGENDHNGLFIESGIGNGSIAHSPVDDIWLLVHFALNPIPRKAPPKNALKPVNGIHLASRTDGICYVYARQGSTSRYAPKRWQMVDWIRQHQTDAKGKKLLVFDRSYDKRPGWRNFDYFTSPLFLKEHVNEFEGAESMSGYLSREKRYMTHWVRHAVSQRWHRFEPRGEQKARLHKSEIEDDFVCATILRNGISCNDGNRLSRHYDRPAPTPHEYFQPRHPDHPALVDEIVVESDAN